VKEPDGRFGPPEKKGKKIDRASGKRIIPEDCAGFWFVCKAHSLVHIWKSAGGCNALDRPIDKKDVESFFSTALALLSIY
jgi:hypothetical protein